MDVQAWRVHTYLELSTGQFYKKLIVDGYLCGQVSQFLVDFCVKCLSFIVIIKFELKEGTQKAFSEYCEIYHKFSLTPLWLTLIGGK